MTPEGTDPAPERPVLRGRFHQAAFFLSIPAAIALVALARSPAAHIAVGVYGMSLIAMFGTSAAYHRGRWRTVSARSRMRRLDHSMIYVLIAGTYTPFSLLVLRPPWGTALLSVVVTGAVAGILIKVLAIDRLSIVGAALYLVLGWVVVLAAPQVVRTLQTGELLPLVAGGVIYTLGAVVLFTGKPDPSPRVFGYHEVFHLSTVVAALCHYTSVLQVVLALR